ncbi:MAG: hypothetical protein IPG89_02810 [Bacteroidetes bacterium]|nr:hypothetical protein [Bacteroidota bacterium]
MFRSFEGRNGLFVVNPCIKNSMGLVRGKTDSIDASFSPQKKNLKNP